MERPSLILLQSRKLTVDTFESDDLLYLRFSGALDEDFAGKALATRIQARTVVLQLADIKHISSFGIREWTEFIHELDQRADRIVLIECAPRIVDQLNMVANFAGSGRVFSFYAPYLCDHCGSERRVILQIDRDWEVIKSMRPPELPCPGCSELQHFDEDPVTYFSYMVKQGTFSLPDEIGVLLTSPAQYRPSVVELSRRLEVDKQIEGQYTYIRLSGDLDTSFPRGKLAEGLEGTVIVDMSDLGRLEPGGLAEWHDFLQMLTPAVTSFSVKGIPSAFLEKLNHLARLGPRMQVLDFSLVYQCQRCHISELRTIDVATHIQSLCAGEMPTMRCNDCQGPTRDTASYELREQVRRLPEPDIDDATRLFIAKARVRQPERPVTEASVLPRTKRSSKRVWFAVIASLAIAGAAVAYALTRPRATTEVVAGNPLGKLLEASAENRPDWLTIDTELAGDCRTSEDLAITCTGVSSLHADRAAAEKYAREAAVESALRAVGLLIEDVDWSFEIGGVYGRVRQAKVAEFSNEQLRDQRSIQYQQAKDELVRGRERVVAALAAIDDSYLDADTPDGIYWEKYRTPGADEDKYLAFAHYQLDPGEVNRMLDFFSARDEALGLDLATGFPGLGWLFPEFAGGVVVLDIGDSFLADSGLTRGDIITAVQGRPIKDVKAFIQVLDYQIGSVQQGGGTLQLTVMTGDDRAKKITISSGELNF